MCYVRGWRSLNRDQRMCENVIEITSITACVDDMERIFHISKEEKFQQINKQIGIQKRKGMWHKEQSVSQLVCPSISHARWIKV